MKSTVSQQRDQPKKLSKLDDKRNVSHNWNSRLFFQVGLIVSLLITGIVMESTIGLSIAYAGPDREYGIVEPPVITFVVEPPESVSTEKPDPDPKPPKKREVITSVITRVKNNMAVTETPVAPSTPKETPSAPTVVKPVVPEKDEGSKSIMDVEFVPVFPGCEGLENNEERLACMSMKVRSFVGRKFDIDKFHYLDPGTKVRIYVDFKIDQSGNVTEIIARAPDRKLEEEATRVIGKLPQMTPGRQYDKAVKVQYLVPITLQIQ